MRKNRAFITIIASVLICIASLLCFLRIEKKLSYGRLEDYLATHEIISDMAFDCGAGSPVIPTALEDGAALEIAIPAEASKITADFSYISSLELAGHDVNKGDDISPLIVPEEPMAIRAKAPGGEVLYEGNITFRRLENIPSVYITVSEDALDVINESSETGEKPRMEGRMSVITPEGVMDASGDITLFKRGNTTFDGYDIKPYNMNLKKASKTLGMPAGRKWALKPNATDSTQYLRNTLALDAGSLAGLAPNPAYRYAALYINGSFRGLYLILQRIEPKELMGFTGGLDKINKELNPDNAFIPFADERSIDDGAITIRGFDASEPSSFEGEYLLELDYRYKEEPCYFTYEGAPIVVKYPEEATEGELTYIARRYREASDAVKAWDHPEKYLDMESFVKMYVIQDLFAQGDVDFSSFYFYLGSDGLFHAGPLWDFDISCGMVSSKVFHTSLAKNTRFFKVQKRKCAFLDDLEKSEEFRKLAAGYYLSTFAPAFDKAIKDTSGYAGAERACAIQKAFGMIRNTGVDSFDDESALISWTEDRSAFLKEYYASPDDYIDVHYHFAWGDISAAYKKGEPIGALPTDDNPGNSEDFWGVVTGFVDDAGNEITADHIPSEGEEIYAVYEDGAYAWAEYSLP